MKKFKILILINLVVLGGCASTTIPKGEIQVTDVYEQMDASEVIDASSHRIGELEDYTADSKKQLAGLYKQLPNPEFLVYVAPHISFGGLPIPGYTTQLKLFQVDHYALPNEKIGKQKR